MLAGLLPCVSSVSWAAAEAAAAGEADEKDSGGLGLSGMVILDQSVGVGSFYRADAAEIVPALSFIGRWKIPGTEAMSKVLKATGASLAEFGAMVHRPPPHRLPIRCTMSANPPATTPSPGSPANGLRATRRSWVQ